MADKADQQHPQGLTCPLCLETFKYPTLLRCGHTFCKVCLENYDQEHNCADHIECPVCRKRTKLDENRIAGLSPNIPVMGLQDKLHMDEHLLPNICVLHEAEYRNIFCEVCKTFICITCFIKNHQGHKIIKKQDFKDEVRKKKVTLIQESKTRKPLVEKIVNTAKQQREEVHRHFTNMEREIKDEFAKKLASLQENEKTLLKMVHNIQSGSNRLLERCIANNAQLIDNINSSVAILSSDSCELLKDNMLIDHHMKCIDLENILRKSNDEQSLARVHVAVRSKFQCANGKLLDLGHIGLGGKGTLRNIQLEQMTNSQQEKSAAPANTLGHIGPGGAATACNSQQEKTSAPANMLGHTGLGGSTTASNSQQEKTVAPAITMGHIGLRGSTTASNSQKEKTVPPANTLVHTGLGGSTTASNSQQEKMAASVNANFGEIQPSVSSTVAHIPAVVSANSLTIKQHTDLIYGVRTGIAALSQDSVVVAYGRSKHGSDCYFVSGDEKPYLDKKEGTVGDFTILSDGRSVASCSRNTCRVYDAHGESTGIQYTLQRSNTYPKLCNDQHDNIYAVNGNPEIYIFNGSNPNPQRVIPTGRHKPRQICVTKAGVMITSTCDTAPSTVTVFDREGRVGIL